MSLKNHPFFRMLDLADLVEKRSGRWGLGENPQKAKFMRVIREAHPFVFDRTVTATKRMEGRSRVEFEDIVQDFSPPFKTTLYLLTDPPSIFAPAADGTMLETRMYGYLLQENTPETFTVWSISEGNYEGRPIPLISSMEIDLKQFASVKFDDDEQTMTIRHEDGNMEFITDDSLRMDEMKETGVILQLTRAISVKRLGVEHIKSFSIKNRSATTGFTSVKTPNLYHIADRREYEYTTSEFGGEVSWEWKGFWRGHWRAFYAKDSNGYNRKDAQGRNVVDYGKTGKDRQGDYCVPGYTWVVEHIKGDPKLAEIKVHHVVTSDKGRHETLKIERAVPERRLR